MAASSLANTTERFVQTANFRFEPACRKNLNYNIEIYGADKRSGLYEIHIFFTVSPWFRLW